MTTRATWSLAISALFIRSFQPNKLIYTVQLGNVKHLVDIENADFFPPGYSISEHEKLQKIESKEVELSQMNIHNLPNNKINRSKIAQNAKLYELIIQANTSSLVEKNINGFQCILRRL